MVKRNGGERDLGLKINMIMGLTETNNQHRQIYSYGSGWLGEPQESAER